MNWSFPIGRLFGSQLRVHVTFLLLIAFIGVSAYAQGGLVAALWTILFVLLLFACVVAHEFGHALMARRYGIRTPDVTLLPIGGLARLEKMPENPLQEIAVALAGPAVNLVIWALLSLLFPAPEASDAFVLNAQTLPGQLARLNLILAVFNLLPAFPMDGGRVLRAALSLTTDRVNATRIAASTGQAVAFLMGLFGLYTGQFMLVLIAGFIFMAAGGESADVAMRAVARRLLARDAMITEYEALRPDDTIQIAGTTLIRTTQHEFPVLDPAGQLAGFLTREALFAAMAQGQPGTRVGDAMVQVPVATLTDGLENVLKRLGNDAPAVAVVDEHRYLLGYITRENVGELMVIANARSRG
ncbi:site-2 protease family protein [Aliiroseovarius subalbicans]|uniref:site-2 protease family protein n=1 Tax=Aliiroseovarius subalbicans TaxID=2925840 RepID=UPI001F579B75|nr:site-2 protease family protein [Aliiroseovarius subalbicans]MCI2398351.1 site-2 protease family protein [Aliiroseovarius subalbicans]